MLDIIEIDRELLEDENILYLENDKIKIGVNLGLGGAVTYLAEHGKKNLVNSYDWGRQIQMSFYSGPVPYEPEGFSVREEWKSLGWNPIQSGDSCNHPSKILEYKKSENEIYVKSIPMQWPMDNCPGECTFETWYQLDGYKVNVRARLVNNRADKTQYSFRHQELPAVYTNGEWYKLVSYIGNNPCTGDSVTEVCNKENGRGWPWIGFKATEGWAALVDDNNYGLGLYNNITVEWIGGFAGEMGSGEAKDFPTGYISPVACDIIDHNIVYDYDYTLIIGDVDSIREYSVARIKEENVPVFTFENTRNHFCYHGIVDQGYPTNGFLEFDHAPHTMLIGPTKTFDCSKYDFVVIDAEFEKEVSGSINLTCYDGQYHERSYQFPVKLLPYTFTPNGRQLYKVALDCDERIVGLNIWFGNEGHAKIYSIALQ